MLLRILDLGKAKHKVKERIMTNEMDIKYMKFWPRIILALFTGGVFGGVQLLLLPDSYVAAVIFMLYSALAVYLMLTYMRFTRSIMTPNIFKKPLSKKAALYIWSQLIVISPLTFGNSFIRSVLGEDLNINKSISLIFMFGIIMFSSYIAGFIQGGWNEDQDC